MFRLVIGILLVRIPRVVFLFNFFESLAQSRAFARNYFFVWRWDSIS